MTKQEAFEEINRIQDEYVIKLLDLINSCDYEMMKIIDFTSPTGTGKTKMMSKLINLLPDCYFIVTTLSKGQLHLQVRENLIKDCNQENFYVYGSADYKINSKLDAEDIIGKIPQNTKCIWLRDEGHIKTNRYDEILKNICYKVINFSATNPHSDIHCNFTQTMMLRTVNQTSGTPEDAINRLIKVKNAHKKVKQYNPCAIFRCITGNKDIYNSIVRLCKEKELKYIDITDDPYVMAELCEDDNEYDVIINKYKIVEGIDIRRAHVLYMDNQPDNNATTIQAIGRCRRNALLYRNDIDILAPSNKSLLNQTRECYVYYNVKNMRIETDDDGELQYAFCNHISCEELNPGARIEVNKGRLSNGLYILELEGQTGTFTIKQDEETGFNIVEPITEYYSSEETYYVGRDNYIYFPEGKVHLRHVSCFPMTLPKGMIEDPNIFWHSYQKNSEPYYDFLKTRHHHAYIKYTGIKTFNAAITSKESQTHSVLELFFISKAEKYTMSYIKKRIKLDGGKLVNLPTVILYIDTMYLYFLSVFGIACIANTTKRKSIQHINSFIDDDRKRYERRISTIFDGLDTLLNQLDIPAGKSDDYAEEVYKRISVIKECALKREPKVNEYDYEAYIEPLTKEEKTLIKLNQLPIYIKGHYKNTLLTKKAVEEYLIRVEYKKIINDRHSAMIGTDTMKQIRTEKGAKWIESRALTAKVSGYTKLNRYLTNRYSVELGYAKPLCFSGENHFGFEKRLNSIIGYCVEYYSKYLLYGEDYLYPHIGKAFREAHYWEPINPIIIRACILKYKELMTISFGSDVVKTIYSISVEQLMDGKYKEFVELVVELGTRTAEYVKSTLYKGSKPVDDIDPNLSVRHIAGLADYITRDTILDVKVRNNIDEKCIKQVLAYHYLSTKRSDLDIKRVIVYDAVSNRDIVIPIKLNNQKSYFIT